MDVTIGHVHDSRHKFKPRNLQDMEAKKRAKYTEHYQQQRLAFAPIVANTIGQFGPDCLNLLWILADNASQMQYGFSLDNVRNLPESSESTLKKQEEDYRVLSGKKYYENRKLGTVILPLISRSRFYVGVYAIIVSILSFDAHCSNSASSLV